MKAVGHPVISFEPLSGPSAIFRRVFAADGAVTLHDAAVGPVPGQAGIHLSARDDSSSLLPITARQNALFPGTGEAGKATIRVARLADYLPATEIAAPALLKLDVQGFELQALAGCGEALLDRFAWVTVECSFVALYAGQAFADAVIAWLRERGFRLSGVYNMAYDGDGRAVLRRPPHTHQADGHCAGMRFLVDAQLPRHLAVWLTAARHDAIHTLDLPQGNRTPDDEICRLADAQQRVVITKDADFCTPFSSTRARHGCCSSARATFPMPN